MDKESQKRHVNGDHDVFPHQDKLLPHRFHQGSHVLVQTWAPGLEHRRLVLLPPDEDLGWIHSPETEDRVDGDFYYDGREDAVRVVSKRERERTGCWSPPALTELAQGNDRICERA